MLCMFSFDDWLTDLSESGGSADPCGQNTTWIQSLLAGQESKLLTHGNRIPWGEANLPNYSKLACLILNKLTLGSESCALSKRPVPLKIIIKIINLSLNILYISQLVSMSTVVC